MTLTVHRTVQSFLKFWRVEFLLLSGFIIRGDNAEHKDTVSFTLPVKEAAVSEGCASVWNWYIQWRVDWRHLKLIQRCWWRACGVNCLELQELDCLNCEGEGSILRRNLIVIYRLAWSHIGKNINIQQFWSEYTRTLTNYVTFDNIKRKFPHI